MQKNSLAKRSVINPYSTAMAFNKYPFSFLVGAFAALFIGQVCAEDERPNILLMMVE